MKPWSSSVEGDYTIALHHSTKR